MKKRIVFFYIFGVLPFLFLLNGCKLWVAADRAVFTSEWTWSSEESDFSTFEPIPQTMLYSMENLLQEERGYVLLRNTFVLPESLKNQELGLYIGRLDIAAEISVNGFPVGMRGIFPPHEFAPGTGSESFRLNDVILNKDGENEILIKLWIEGVGGLQEMPFITTYRNALMAAKTQTFLLSEINLLFAASILLIAIFYFFLYVRRPVDKEYLMYSLTNLCTSFYLFPFFISEVPWLLGFIPFLMYKKIFSAFIAFVTVYFATSFIRTYLKIEDSKSITIIRLLLLLVPIVNAFTITDIQVFYIILPLLFSFVFFQLLFAVYAIIISLKNNLHEVLTLLLGFSPVLVGVAVDFFVHAVFRHSTAPWFTVFGWQATITMFLLILANRYSSVRKRAEYLNAKLEAEVTERTLELTATNEKMQREREQSVQDMNLAVHVQRSFYPHDISVMNGWDAAVYFKPLSGVSGDLYDFYIFDRNLSGLSLFDVSGHGIAAGLVTMLSKNIVFRAFKSNLDKPLPVVMEKLNDAIIRAKGSIENYLTGTMIRLDAEDDHKIDMVNAGNPPPLLHRKNSDTAMPLVHDKSKVQCGMIGIPGLAVSFQPVSFIMENGDSLILYTDGITESRNMYGEEFAQERLISSFAKAGSGSAEKKLASILHDFMVFVGDAPLKDDITIIVLKRVKPKPVAAPLADSEEVLELEELEPLEEVLEEELEPLEEELEEKSKESNAAE